ncbi:zeta toxin family protein [Rhizobium sp. 16-449-1b]|uniref:zeta toxin family protein n=1 Tax=Rhizobium sp. 16-449-1b TaxID=2819989 RepID=UPI001ADD286F|nr:zeta toxin family protein [Rhizobium sp. 16-449-1b]MBO9195171.1 zeta toxin family protein [Rhizobium sp. 16-449-1b]
MPELSCVLLAGPNGSGKSSAFPKLKLEGELINADEIARDIADLSGSARDWRAGQIALKKLAEMIDTRRSFIFETTLASQHSIRLMREAKVAGFTVGLYYTALDSVETNIERVRQRVLKGGHSIPEDVIRRRHSASFLKLSEALETADEVVLVDNSNLEPHVVFEITSGEVLSFDVDETQALHRQFETKVCDAYGLVRTGNTFSKR